MLHIQSAQQRSDRRWDLSDMERRFETALEAGKVVDQLHRQLKTINYNSDLRKFLKNIEDQVAELSSAEVVARQSHKSSLVERPLENLHKSIDYLEKLILIAKLSE
jgi:polyhydroxyalkanoate synthesis regulator phasin